MARKRPYKGCKDGSIPFLGTSHNGKTGASQGDSREPGKEGVEIMGQINKIGRKALSNEQNT